SLDSMNGPSITSPPRIVKRRPVWSYNLYEPRYRPLSRNPWIQVIYRSSMTGASLGFPDRLSTSAPPAMSMNFGIAQVSLFPRSSEIEVVRIGIALSALQVPLEAHKIKPPTRRCPHVPLVSVLEAPMRKCKYRVTTSPVPRPPWH